ncbi:methyl-accepting chemotaxis protein [Marinospirillum perlucidum]|uniref:methyl-accepting chemotaxis protein n=1 Tax=Marinospirillum perlucidum TaxID=1982602 RepID=UPI000DF34F85|nr:methyl-accepting chemotaxis protein [Marinospirillum perlucidum]
MFNLHSLGLRLKIIPLVSLVGFLLMASVALEELDSTLIHEKESQLVSIVEMAQGVLAHYQAKEANGELTRNQAQQEALDTLEGLRYAGNEYLWVNTLEKPLPRMVMHPTVPALNGQVMEGERFQHAQLLRNRQGDQLEQLDNQNLFVAFVETVERFGSGFVEYKWPKPLAEGGVTEERFTKLSYVAGDTTWGWVLGTGVYIDDVSAQFWQLALKIAVLTLVGVLLILVFTFVMQRSVVNPMARNAARLKDADRDLSLRLQADEKNELGQLFNAFNQHSQALGKVLHEVTATAADLATSTQQVLQVSQESARMAHQQQSETDQVASATTEMAASSSEVAEHARATLEAAEQTQVQTDHGQEVVAKTIADIEALAGRMEKMLAVIERLDSGSQNIGEVINTIAEIAEQTNLLALNAAIEAARAGEQGRGFAVVADEVRSLASRTQDATGKIHEIIAEVQSAAQDVSRVITEGSDEAVRCAQQARLAGEALDAINLSVGQVTERGTQIEQAAREQSQVAEDISASMVRINELAEQSSQAVVETEQVNQGLAGRAKDLKQLVAGFRF